MPIETKFIRDFRAAKLASVPLISVETADPANCMRQILLATMNVKPTPLISWDKVQGFTPKNQEGEVVLTEVLGATTDQSGDQTNTWKVEDMHEALVLARGFPGKSPKFGGTILFIMNAHLQINHQINTDADKAIQALWNLRDEFKKNFRTAVLLGPEMPLPAELKHDVLPLDDPLPTIEDLKLIVKNSYKSAKLNEPDEKIIYQAIEAGRGLSSFEAEQVYATSLTPDGLDFDQLWDKKRKQIEQTPGLRIWRGKETYNDVRGVENMKNFMTMIMEGEEPPTVIVFWDEVEKAFAGTMGDMSGVSQEMHGQILSWMADNEVLAAMFVGHPGCSKTYIAQATAGQFKKPLVLMNISELKGSLVGQSTSQTKDALKIISAIGRPLVLATSNNQEALSPELKDRFNLGTFFFDLPTREEREAVWDVWMKKCKIAEPNPASDPDKAAGWDKDWTPRNIRDCCKLAWRLRKTLAEASDFIVPVIRANPQRIEQLRAVANDKFLSASHPGVYHYTKPSAVSRYLDNDGPRVIDVGKVGKA